MGITQHSCGTDNVRAIANLATLTGNIGRECTGVNPLRGQNNVQGASDAACLPNVYPGYQKVDLPEIQAEVRDRPGGCSSLPKPGLTATEMMNAAVEGKLKAMYIMGENPIITDPNMHHTIKALKNLEFLVVQDIFLTETAHLRTSSSLRPALSKRTAPSPIRSERCRGCGRRSSRPERPGTTFPSSWRISRRLDIQWNTIHQRRYWRNSGRSGPPWRDHL